MTLALGMLGLVIPGAFLWFMSKYFITRKEFDGFGARVGKTELDAVESHTRADTAHERVDRIESALAVELRYIRRDLDILLEKSREEQK
jgi:CRISPR/Cas system-associated exonuclease Cas4 (RecB family)